MCGIIGYTGSRNAPDVVLKGLENLEYRGYDSAGMVVLTGETADVRKEVGEVHELSEKHDIFAINGHTGIGHTRWATHGKVSQENAHPHTCCTGRVAIVHNGIIENYEQFKAELIDHEFVSETDSEVIAHYLGQQLNDGKTISEAIESFASRATGTFAVVAVDTETETLFGFRRGSPLAVGIGNGEKENFIGSDVHAFGDYTRDVVFLEDEEYVILKDDDVSIHHLEDGQVDKEITTVDDSTVGNGKQGFEHYMLKEIHEQPDALYRLEKSLTNSQQENVKQFVELLQEKEKVLFTAAGTSYHATLLGVYYLQKAGIEAQTLISSEFQNYERVDEDTLLVAVSQSGETRDTLDAIEYSKERGAEIASIVNMPHSAIQRESTVSLEIQAGKEVAVAATKSFSNTVLTLLQLAIAAGYDGEIGNVAEKIRYVIEQNKEHIKELAAQLADEEDMYIIGRGPTYPIAREIALKLKELPYVHAEGMMGGELKHGTLALIEDGTPVLALIPEENDEIVSNVHEVEARGGEVIKISPFYGDIDIPEDRDGFPLYATTIGFLLAYYLGQERGCPIDKPRNLAKTVTVR